MGDATLVDVIATISAANVLPTQNGDATKWWSGLLPKMLCVATSGIMPFAFLSCPKAIRYIPIFFYYNGFVDLLQ
jgi:hypothetical protein